MSNPVISIENLSKAYQLGVIGTGTFRGDMHRWWAKMRGLPDPHLKIGAKIHSNRDGETVWALKDINLQVPQGEALGIIGRNGAGKSTLLKILSRVTAPTSGVIKTKGRIASLLEIGTGFHPELTGRENIYLNGAIMGMNRREIMQKLDEIVDFSGVEQYIDTPVKRYSSGMYVRLAFAVAAYLEPEILVVDEVLAVGDVEFQMKCLGKMEDVSHKEGRTVLFVSHNMNAVRRLVDRCVWIDRGEIVRDGDPHDVIDSYLGSGSEQKGSLVFKSDENFAAQILRVSVLNQQGVISPVFEQAQDFTLDIEFTIRNPGLGIFDVVVIVALINGEGVYCFELSNLTGSSIKWTKGVYRLRAKYPTHVLNAGKYIVRACIALGHKAYHNHPNNGEGVVFEIIDTINADIYSKKHSTDICLLSIEPDHELIKEDSPLQANS